MAILIANFMRQMTANCSSKRNSRLHMTQEDLPKREMIKLAETTVKITL